MLDDKPLFEKPAKSFYTPWGLAFVLVFLFLFQIIFYFLAVYTGGLIYDLGFHGALNLLNEPDGTSKAINLARYTNVVSFTGYMFLPVLLFTIINKTSLSVEGGLKIPMRRPLFFLSILILALTIPLVDYVTGSLQNLDLPQSLKYWANRFEQSREEQFNTLLEMHQPSELIFCILTIGLLPAVLEEFMFRGVIMNIFLKILRNKNTAIFLQAIVFSVLHFSFYQLPGILFMGILFGFVAQKTGTILYGIIMHFLFNTTTIVLYYLNFMEFDKSGVFGKYQSLPLNIFTAIACFFGIVIFLRLFNRVIRNSHE
ncbi:MAG: CPBP family intramembrane metalloprotease [Bacteroidetes bacterium]|nr:CPBP family intramembrane metalloprotease [Bacteroidota bacterium]